MDIRGTHHVVRRQTPMRRFFLSVLIMCLLGWGGWTLFDLGRMRAGFDSTDTQRKLNLLELRVGELGKENEHLKEKLAFVEQGKVIDRQAYNQVEGDMRSLQSELAELKQQVQFYQGIISPDDDSAGVRVQSFDVTPQNGSERFDYKLILIQGPARAKRVRGTVSLVVRGQQEGRDVELPLPRVSRAKTDALTYDFKYYQNFQGTFEFPAGFRPKEVLVSVAARGPGPGVKVPPNQKRVFQWKEVIT